MLKKIIGVHQAFRDDIGDLVTRRPIPGSGVNYVDPFLFLNHHGPQVYPPANSGLPFGPHPHRGFETVTFIVQGALAHLDSNGNSSVIGAGGVQWMTAGAGIVHAEVSPDDFKRDGGPLEILQLWINLPARLKMAPPAYVGLQESDINYIIGPGRRVALISGELDGQRGPVSSLTGVFMSVVHFEPGGALSLDGLTGRSVFLYVIRGAISAQGAPARSFQLVEMEVNGDSLSVVAQERSAILLGHADPLGEAVAAHGPFVMNTFDEIRAAVDDYRAGKFGAVTL